MKYSINIEDGVITWRIAVADFELHESSWRYRAILLATVLLEVASDHDAPVDLKRIAGNRGQDLENTLQATLAMIDMTGT